MNETVFATLNDVKFIQGATKLTQPNWQAYFGAALPNGVYKGLKCSNYFDGAPPATDPRYLTDGIVFANGIMAEIKTDDGYTNLGPVSSSDHDRFVCLRVFFGEEKAQIVFKTGIATYSSTQLTYNNNTFDEMVKFIDDESHCCSRNDNYYDIPLFYSTNSSNSTWLVNGRDLRRIIDPTAVRLQDPNISGYYGSAVPVSGQNNYTYKASTVPVYMDTLNCPNGATYSVLGYSSAMTLKLGMYPFCNFLGYSSNDLNAGVYLKVNYIFSDPSDWSTSGNYYTMTIPANTDTVIKFTLVNKAPVTNDGITYQKQTYLVEVYQ